MKKITLLLILLSFVLLVAPQSTQAGWVNGYFRSDGTYVNGYYRTELNYYKWDNLSWDGDWSDSLNDKSWYRDYGYDPEPWDNEIPNYSYWNTYDSYNHSYDYDNWYDDYFDNSSYGSNYDNWEDYSWDNSYYSSNYDWYSW